MSRISRVILIFTLICAGPPAFPKQVQDRLKKGTAITVDEYGAVTDVFLVTINEEPAIGPNYAKAQDLMSAIDFDGPRKSFDKQIKQMIGSVYQLKKDLPLVDELDVMKMLKEKAKKSK